MEDNGQKTNKGVLRRGHILPRACVLGPATVKDMKTNDHLASGKEQLDNSPPGRGCRNSHAHIRAFGTPRFGEQFDQIDLNLPSTPPSRGLHHEIRECRETLVHKMPSTVVVKQNGNSTSDGDKRTPSLQRVS